MQRINPDEFLCKDEIDFRARNIDPQLFYEIGKNLVTGSKNNITSKPLVVSAGDSRKDTKQLLTSLETGITSARGIVLSLGIDIPKPLAYFAGEMFQAEIVAYITASHVNADYNGIKINRFCRQPRLILKKENHLDLSEVCRQSYQDYLANYFRDLPSKQVILDCMNGSSSCLAKQVFERICFSVKSMRDFIDRSFSSLVDNAPDPHDSRNLENLMQEAKKCHSPGFAFDGDMDRIVAIDEGGQKLSEDEAAILISRYLLEHTEQNSCIKQKIVYDLKCSNAIREEIEKAGGEAIMQKTGWQNIKRKMQETRAVFGAEASGHYFYGKSYYVPTGDDGLFTALMICRIVSESKKELKELRKDFAKYSTSNEIRIKYRRDKNERLIRLLEDSFSKAGYRTEKIGNDFRFEKYSATNEWQHWMLIRNSSTEPEKLTIRFEGRTQKDLEIIIEEFKKRIPEEDVEIRDKIKKEDIRMRNEKI